MVAQLPHSKKVPRASLCAVCMFSCLCVFPSGIPNPPAVQRREGWVNWRVLNAPWCSPAVALDQSTGLRTGVGPQALHYGCPLLLSN